VEPNHFFNRRSIRLNGYAYSLSGVFFLTMVTHGYKCILGNKVDKEMQMSDLGKIVEGCWKGLPAHFKRIEVEPFVIMPNHLHGIITIHEADCRGTIYHAPTIEQYSKPIAGLIP
jgi:putative transposase